jgi:hypothetical protein
MASPSPSSSMPSPGQSLGFDRLAFRGILEEVDATAVRVRGLLEEERVSYIQALGVFLVAVSATLLAGSGGLFGYSGPGWWLFSAAGFAIGIVVLLFPGRWLRASAQALPREWERSPLDLESSGPDLSRTVRVISQMQKDWDALQIFSVMAPILLAVACFAGSQALFSVVVAAAQPSTLGSTRLLLLETNLVVVVPGLIVIALWTWSHRARIGPVRHLLRVAQDRFQQLERTFWQRF